jgi:hypothetical protein
LTDTVIIYGDTLAVSGGLFFGCCCCWGNFVI